MIFFFYWQYIFHHSDCVLLFQNICSLGSFPLVTLTSDFSGSDSNVEGSVDFLKEQDMDQLSLEIEKER